MRYSAEHVVLPEPGRKNRCTDRWGPVLLRCALLPGLLSTLSLSGTLSPAAAQTVSGHVVERETREPVHSALVVLSGTNPGSFTDEDGLFRFQGVPPGPYRITVHHPGYEPLRHSLDVPAEGIDGLVLSLERHVIPLDSLQVRAMPAPERRQETWHSHHVFVTRQQLEEYELRGAWHGGDIFRALSPFPGVGLRGNTCGAVTGSLMAIGLIFGREAGEGEGKLARALAMGREFSMRFEETVGSTDCRDIHQRHLGRSFDLADAGEMAAFWSVVGELCPNVVAANTRIASEMIDARRRAG